MKRELIEVNGHRIEAVEFRNTLLRWGRTHFRQFPWRMTRDPYAVLMAELMLHRTQVSQVTCVYTRFISTFPNLNSLAKARKRNVASLLKSLGLRWRIDLIPSLARTLVRDFGATIPENKNDLCRLPGVSDYIASATMCFAFAHPEPLMDTNTVRIAGRLFGLQIKDSSRRNPIFREALSQLLDRKRSRAYNYALLDHAHEICRKKDPVCEICPVLRWCVFGQNEVAGLRRRHLHIARKSTFLSQGSVAIADAQEMLPAMRTQKRGSNQHPYKS